MIIYYAGIDSHVLRLYTLKNNGGKNLMLSFYYRTSDKQMKRFLENDFRIMMDSGAFSAWKKDAVIDIDEYIWYINYFNIKNYINLDVVGSPDKTEVNQKYMESKGMKPIPVFHYGTDEKYLNDMCKRYDYVCLGGTVGLPPKKRIEFFDLCFAKHTTTKFHGLGVSSPTIMKRFNWYSVDSTSWLQGAKTCRLITDTSTIKLPSDMDVQERLGLNVKFFVEFEKSKSLVDGW